MVNSVEMNKQLLEWLRNKLKEEYGGEAEELIKGLKDLDERNIALLLEKHDKATDIYSAGELIINRKKRTVIKNGEELFLTPKEFDILYFLFENRGEVFTKEQIYSAVWKEEYLLSESNMMAFIRKLRKKIEEFPDNPKYILTIWGVGYKFNDKI